MQIHAIATDPPAAITAALASRDVQAIVPKLRASGVTLDRRLTIAELDRQLAKLPVRERIEIKSVLGRAGLLI